MPIRIKFEPLIYPEDAVRRAAEAFGDSVQVRLETAPGAIWAVFEGEPEDGNVYDEFCNFVIAECRSPES